MLCGFPTVQQAAIGDCLSFDPFSFDQNGLAPPEVDVAVELAPDGLRRSMDVPAPRLTLKTVGIFVGINIFSANS